MNQAIRDTQAAIDGLAKALLPISRVLVRGNLGAGPLVVAAKLAYLRAAIEAVPRRGGRLNISRLAVATGMTRKEVSSLVKNTKTRGGREARKLGSEQRALRVVRGWLSDPRFKSADGRPALLSLRGGHADFASLVRTYGGDVTLASVLAELQRTNVVELTGHRKVRLKRFNQRFGARSLTGLSEFALLLNDFVDSTSQVFDNTKRPLFFGFRDCIVTGEQQSALFHRVFARRAAALLTSIDQWRARSRAQERQRVRKTDRKLARVGLGIYLVHRGCDLAGPCQRSTRK
jgi:hypothetical protein